MDSLDINHKKLYFGYGSNMWKDQMRRRCPHSNFVGVGVFRGWKWIINTRGYANVVPSPDDEVYGLLYEMTREDEIALNGYEGFPEIYQRQIVDIEVKSGSSEVINAPGKKVMAIVYIDNNSTTGGDPKEEYIGRMNEAIKDALKEGVPENYIQKYLRKSIPDISTTSSTAATAIN
ncbi:Butirosin biosynthesis, BtrG-like protein [Amanita rubescens]|nr:Butirosin biosynthesis, BtrG-like protein [Amanita rubescens]